MDKPNSQGNTLLSLCQSDERNVDVSAWDAYYADPSVQDKSRGLLPFRVWQFYQGMVEYLRKGQLTEFVCAAGILSHYVGDACQPLHISYLFNGDPDDTERVTERDRRTGETKEVQRPRAAGVHAAYEDDMVNYHIQEILDALETVKVTLPSTVRGGHAAAVAIVGLMRKTFATIAPRQVVDAYLEVKGQPPRSVADHLWERFGSQTASVLAAGATYLAMLWESAWKEGRQAGSRIKSTAEIPEAALEKIYRDPGFMPSHTLHDIGPLLSQPRG